MHPYIESTAAAYVAARTERDDAAALHIADKLLALVALAEREAALLSVPSDDPEALGTALDAVMDVALGLLAREDIPSAERLELAKRVKRTWGEARGRTWRA
jgi:hypothetical protein